MRVYLEFNEQRNKAEKSAYINFVNISSARSFVDELHESVFKPYFIEYTVLGCISNFSSQKRFCSAIGYQYSFFHIIQSQ